MALPLGTSFREGQYRQRIKAIDKKIYKILTITEDHI